MFGLPENVLELLQHYFVNHTQIIKVMIYGSRAMGRDHSGSDIDIAIITSTKDDIAFQIKRDLEALPTPYLFDVIDYRYITNAPLRAHIDRVGKTLFER